MTTPTEIATIIVNGQEFSDWETVSVEIDAETADRMFQFSVSEAVYSNGPATLATQQFKPGDACQVMLAGQKVCDGYVIKRQAAYDANTHAVLIIGKSKTGDIVKSSAPLTASQMQGYPFAPIATALLQPFGIQFVQASMPDGADKPFKDVSVWPGESVFACLDRLARQRGIYLHDDEEGNLVAGFSSGGGATSLIEGQNIKSANCSIDDETAFSQVGAIGTQRGDDHTDDETARKPSAYLDGPGQRYSPHIVLAEEPGDADDMQKRAQHESNILSGAIINASVTVYGWLKNDGSLWKEGETVHVTSPMLLLDMDLAVKTIRFFQDNENGTGTTLTLVRPEALGQVGPLPAPAPSSPSIST